jgi:hypothetical protein
VIQEPVLHAFTTERGLYDPGFPRWPSLALTKDANLISV